MKVVEEVSKQVSDEIRDGEFRIVSKERALEKTVEYAHRSDLSCNIMFVVAIAHCCDSHRHIKLDLESIEDKERKIQTLIEERTIAQRSERDAVVQKKTKLEVLWSLCGSK